MKPQDFYQSRAWLELRYRVLRKFESKCMACGATQADKAVIQVDHIKPRSLFPELELDESNLQVLCKPCNQGKSNLYSDDLRAEVERRKKQLARKRRKSFPEERRRELFFWGCRDRFMRKIARAQKSGNVPRHADAMISYLNFQRRLKETAGAK